MLFLNLPVQQHGKSGKGQKDMKVKAMTKKAFQDTFERFETKYIISKDRLDDLLAGFEGYLTEDEHAYSTISNLYYDTPDFQLIRESLAASDFDEKVRLRTYEEFPQADSPVFLEIKKKDRGLVYKQRIQADLAAAEAYMDGERSQLDDESIRQEMDWLADHYGNLQPMMYIYYNRYSLKGIEDPAFRLTIDHDLTFRHQDTGFLKGHGGANLLPADHVIMEVKAPGACPAWLCDLLDQQQLEPASFSKYGVAYQKTALIQDF